jgi:hypothetical protein
MCLATETCTQVGQIGGRQHARPYALFLRDIIVRVKPLSGFSLHPEIDDFRMDQSAISYQQSAKHIDIMRFFLKAESSMLIAVIRK